MRDSGAAVLCAPFLASVIAKFGMPEQSVFMNFKSVPVSTYTLVGSPTRSTAIRVRNARGNPPIALGIGARITGLKVVI